MNKVRLAVFGAAAMTLQSVAASAAPMPVGLSSNRAALGVSQSSDQSCTVSGGRASCVDGKQSDLAGRSGVFVLVLALIAVGAGVAAAASGHSRPTSP